jgi:hypothetical protein
LKYSILQIKIEKDDVGLELVELERAADLAQEEQQQNEISTKMAAVCLQQEEVEHSKGQRCMKRKEETTESGEEAVCQKLNNLIIHEDTSGAKSEEKDSKLNRVICDNSVEISGSKPHESDSESDSGISGTLKCGKLLVGTGLDVPNLVGCVKDAGETLHDSDDATSDETCSDSISSSCDTCSDSEESDASLSAEEGDAVVKLPITEISGGDLTADSDRKERKLITVIDCCDKPNSHTT